MSNTRGRLAREKRREEAETRQATSNVFTPEQRIAYLDARLGVGVGAVKERARLAKRVGEKNGS